MKEIYSDINIVGGGLIGSVLALSLSKLDLKVTIVEKNPTYNPKKNHTDKRTVAISEGTKHFLDKLELWKDIKLFTEPIREIKVIDRKEINSLNFDNNRRHSNLGYIVRNKIILDILYKNLKKQKNIKIINNSEIKSISNLKENIKIQTQDVRIISNLNIAADGKKSFVRNLLKTPVFKKSYNKKALVLTFNHSIDHNKRAFEIFLKDGPLAILPMKKEKDNFLSSIVWTNKNNYLDALFKKNEKEIIPIINEKVSSFIGNINKIHSKQLFELTAHINTKFFEKRTIYVGDSAHSIHPIAGQGWNLGMSDVSKLFELIKKYKRLGIEVGNALFCEEYHNNVYYEAFALYQITDKLDTIFQIENLPLTTLRSFGLNLIQKNKFLKNSISDFAMGF